MTPPSIRTIRVYVHCSKGHGLIMLGGPDQFGRMVFLEPDPCQQCDSMPPPKDGKLTRKERRAAKRLLKGLEG